MSIHCRSLSIDSKGLEDRSVGYNKKDEEDAILTTIIIRTKESYLKWVLDFGLSRVIRLDL
jgi:hypothetical protein